MSRGIELSDAWRTLRLKADVEVAEVAQAHLVTFEEHLAQAIHRAGEHCVDVGAMVGAAMLGDVG